MNVFILVQYVSTLPRVTWAAAQVIRNRGLELVSGLGHSLELKEIACGGDAAGTNGNVGLAGSRRDRKLKK